MTDMNRRVLLKSRPSGIPQAENFEIVDTPVPEPAAAVVMFIGLIFVAGRQPRVSDSRSHS